MSNGLRKGGVIFDEKKRNIKSDLKKLKAVTDFLAAAFMNAIDSLLVVIDKSDPLHLKFHIKC